MPGPICDVVIPTFNHPELVEECIGRMASTTSVPYQLVLTDDASPDPRMKPYLSSKITQAKVLRNSVNVGFGQNVNRGVRSSYSKYVCILNSDATPLPGWLDVMIDALEAHPEYGIVSPLLLFHPESARGRGGTVQHAGIYFDVQKVPRHRFIGWPPDHPLVRELRDDLQAVTGACMVMKRALWDQLGGFAKEYGRGCLAGDTLVFSEQGMKTLAALDTSSLALSQLDLRVAGRSDSSNTALFYRNGLDETLEVAVQGGFRIKGTPNHKILIMKNDGNAQWERLDNLSVGDYVAIRKGADLFGSRHLESDDAYFLGLYVAEGNMSRRRVSITNTDPEICKLLKGMGFVSYVQKEHWRRNGAGLVDRLISLGIGMREGAREKHVPSSILEGDKSTVVAFLQGLFDGDGTAKKNGTVAYATASLMLARQVQALLLNLGVVAHFIVKPKEKLSEYPQYVLSIVGDADVFYNTIGFRLSRKQTRISLLPRRSKHGHVLPYQMQWLKRLYHMRQKVRGSGEYRSLFSGTIAQRDHSSETSVKKIVDARSEFVGSEEYEHLRQLLDLDYYWAKVTNISPGGFVETFDLTVPGSNSYLANGIVSHNTFEDVELCLRARMLRKKVVYLPDAMLYHRVGASAEDVGGYNLQLNYRIFMSRVGGNYAQFDEWRVNGSKAVVSGVGEDLNP